MPAHAVPRPKFSDKKSNDLQKAIVAYLKDYLGYFAHRQSTEGRYRPGQTIVDAGGFCRHLPGQYIPAHKKGLADVVAALKGGKYVGIEVKIGKDRQREDQKVVEKELKQADAGYILVKTWDDFISKIVPYI
jgi:hypothetical protein